MWAATIPRLTCTPPRTVSAQCYYDNRYWTLWKLPMVGH